MAGGFLSEAGHVPKMAGSFLGVAGRFLREAGTFLSMAGGVLRSTGHGFAPAGRNLRLAGGVRRRSERGPINPGAGRKSSTSAGGTSGRGALVARSGAGVAQGRHRRLGGYGIRSGWAEGGSVGAGYGTESVAE